MIDVYYLDHHTNQMELYEPDEPIGHHNYWVKASLYEADTAALRANNVELADERFKLRQEIAILMATINNLGDLCKLLSKSGPAKGIGNDSGTIA